MSLVDSFSNAPPKQQLGLIAAIAGVVVAVLIAVWLVFFRTPYEPLFTQLRAMDAATIVSALDEKGARYRLRDGGTTILVPRNEVDALRLDLMSAELPLKGVVGFELFNKSDMGLTEFAQKINYQRALQGELARTIMGLDAVESARVHLTLEEATIFRDDRRPSKASVIVFARPGRTISAESVQGIQRLVSAAVSDLDPGSVVVLDAQGRPLTSAVQTERTDPQGAARDMVEAFYEQRALEAIETQYPGLGADVDVTASGGVEQLRSWTPETRSFPLRVAITTHTALSANEEAALRSALMQNLGLGPNLQDSVAVMLAPTVRPGAAPVAPALAPAAEAKPNGLPSAMTGMLATLAIVIIVGTVLAGLAVTRRTRRARLSEEQRQAYARRLRTLLDAEDAHAPAGL